MKMSNIALITFIVSNILINCSQVTQSDRDKCRNGVETPDDQIVIELRGSKAGNVFGFCKVLPFTQVLPSNPASDKKFSRQEMDLLLAACAAATLRLKHCDRKSDFPNLDLTRADE